MSEKYNRHDREFKLAAIKLSFEPGKTAAQVARELDIPVTRLYKWREQFEKKQDNVFRGKISTNTVNLNNELESLSKEVKRLRQERDILKKSLIFFAKDQDNDSSLSDDTNGGSR